MQLAYRDGETQRQAWIDPRVLIEFTALGQEPGPPRPPREGATLLTGGHTRVWLLPEGVDAVALAAAKTAAGEGAYAVGLRSGPSSTDPLLAAAPGLLVQFKAATTPAEREAFAQRHGLTGGDAVNRGPGWHHFEGPVGLPAVDLAATLLASGEVLDASPNWWRPVVPK